MIAIVVVLMVGVNVAIGAWLGLQYLKKAPRQRVLVGFHLILGLSMLEVLAAMLRGTPDGAAISGRTLALATAGLIALAVLLVRAISLPDTAAIVEPAAVLMAATRLAAVV